MPPARTDLSDFARALAARLPGSWSSDYQRHARYEEQFPRTEQLWDNGHVAHIVSQYVLSHDAILHGPEGHRLFIADRPHHCDQFVAASFEPVEDGIKPHHFVGVEEPHGIAIPNDPARAAARIAQRVLPRYERAVESVFDNAATLPDSPHRPAPPQVAHVLTLTLYDDGALGAPYDSVPEQARGTLFACGFQYLPHQAALLLSAQYSENDRSLRVQAAARLLTAQGIGVNLRHVAPTTAAPPPASPQAARSPRR
ncbi:hypothetical protein [Streptomyces sp. SPB162]|uniref:hypothetical protein n=1 Tax=Streptomyces sp. SPB162 TaxID=2940560 RepID=UPI002405300F|nr:hypothetical protein [Streptomyces sp. SPB162]